jgi:predicted Zn-dependent protease
VTVAADRAAVLAALRARRDLADWSVRVVTTQRAWRRLGELAGAGTATGATLVVAIHRDGPAGRGSASFTVTAGADARPLLALAVARAAAALGPSWSSPAPAAPARVDTADPDVAGSPTAAVEALVAELAAAAAPAALTAADVTAEVADVEVVTRREQRAAWRETALAVTATLADGATLDVRARRAPELELAAAIARARAATTRAPLAPGRYPVALTAAALLHGDRGLLAAFVAQADPRLERQGLVRYRPGQPIGAGATLTLTSDGTLPFGWYSAPLGLHGEAVRRFPLVNRGVAVGLGFDDREAALRGELPNGGVRGLVIPPGTDDEATLRADAVVIDALDWLEVEPTTGWFRAGVGGATLRGDAIDLLGRARTSATTWTTPTYRGPALWHLGPVTVD